MTLPGTTLSRSITVLAVVVILSVGGILLAIFVTRNPADAGRGGALASTIALAYLFLGRGHGTMIYSILTKGVEEAERALADIRGAPLDPQPDLKKRFDALEAKFRADAAEQKTQNIFLACSTTLSTLTWGFADIIAAQLIG